MLIRVDISSLIIKEVILCYVIYDKNISIDFTTPECLKQLSILEILLERWVPGNEKITTATAATSTTATGCNQNYDYEFNYD